MLARWFDRSGIGQFLAPDENAAKMPVPEEAKSEIWQILAPDPNFAPEPQEPASEPPKAPPKAPPAEAFPAAPSFGNPGLIMCEKCHQWTPVGPISPAKGPPSMTTPSMKGNPSTPASGLTNDLSNRQEVEQSVLSAAKGTAVSMSSHARSSDIRDKVFRLCACTKPIKEPLAKKFRKWLEKDMSLIHVRSANLGQIIPDGFTPLMGAVYANQLVAAEIILDLSPREPLFDRDLQGRTALHIAAEYGHIEMVLMLQPKYMTETTSSTGAKILSPPPVDLLGRTPFGRAVTSPMPSARKRYKELESALFSPGDVSVVGNVQPEIERTFRDEALQVAYGLADMPGKRVIMEDAVSSCMWVTKGKPYCLLGVCDGHSDYGNASRFVADQTPRILQSLMESQPDDGSALDWNSLWKATCLQVDDELKKEEIAGGSTGVFALITYDEIIVANVGDSRGILIQSSQASMTGLEEKMQKTSIAESTAENEPKPATKEGEEACPVAVALSEDHKPELEEEKARIENAGMKVVSETFQENQKDVTLYKVEKSAGEKLAMSRSFGDFEFKGNTHLGPEEQAISAVPDVRIHTRDGKTDMYLVLACDGVWDVMDNNMVKDFILTQVKGRKDTSDTVLPEVGDALLRECLDKGSRDNMTTIVVALSKEFETIRPYIQGHKLDFGSPTSG